MVNETANSNIINQVLQTERFLGRTLREAREKKNAVQANLAKQLDVKASTISNFEKGQRLPSLVQLARLSQALDLDLQTLILCRAYDELALDDSSKWPKEILTQRKNLISSLQKYVQDARFAASAKSRQHLKDRSFLDFPEAFPNIKIVTGDRRENPPKTVGDIGAYSACPIDDRWLCSLGLPKDAEKVSDKEFVLSPEEKLREKYGNSTLLIIGSPAGNHLARRINPAAIFKFNFQKGYKEALDNVHKDRMVEKTAETAPLKKEEHLKDLKRMMMQFFAFGIIDPVYSTSLRGFALSADVDYATVTFAVNPFYKGDDFRYVAIIVAGFHHPGTIWALRRLSEPRNEKEGFIYRPYGGVLKIEIDTEEPWESRMSKAKCSWDTDSYNRDDLLKGLDELKNCGSSLMHIDYEEVEKCKRLLRCL